MKNILKEILSTSLYILTVLIITYLIVKFVGVRTEVIGPSMQPTLYNGDNLIVEKVSYYFHEPERFDVIVFPFKYAEKTHYIKRIIGLPGERVTIDEDGNIYDILVGTFLVVGNGEEDFCSLSPDAMKRCKERFKYPERFMRFGGEIIALPIRPERGRPQKTEPER